MFVHVFAICTIPVWANLNKKLPRVLLYCRESGIYNPRPCIHKTTQHQQCVYSSVQLVGIAGEKCLSFTSKAMYGIADKIGVGRNVFGFMVWYVLHPFEAFVSELVHVRHKKATNVNLTSRSS